MPSLDEFFAEAIEQADPASMVEDEYKYVCTFESCFVNPIFFFPFLSPEEHHCLLS